ncbi:hypothetical protein A2U01_0080500, partial [Trifolium medium]|nr:hypothetical protein [Trifolium medium]
MSKDSAYAIFKKIKMSYSSTETVDVPSAGKWMAIANADGETRHVPEPQGDKKAKEIWNNQVLIPFSVAEIPH